MIYIRAFRARFDGNRVATIPADARGHGANNLPRLRTGFDTALTSQ